MPTIEELRVAYQDQVTAGAQAGADALNKLADAAETVDTRITAAGRSARGYVNTGDQVTRTANAMERAQRTLADAQTKLDAAMAAGTVTAEEAQRALQTYQAKLDTATQKHKDAVKAAEESSDALDKNTQKVKLSGYQIGILADEAHKYFDQILAGGSSITAAFYQMPNMIQTMGGLSSASGLVADAMMGPAGIAVAALGAGVAIAKFAASAEGEQAQLAGLSQHLRATRDDYDAMASAAETAARQIAAHGDMSLTDARTTEETFAAVPTVSGSQLAGLTQDARNLATVMNETVPDAAKTMAEAMRDPLKAAQDFAQQGILGVNQALVLQIQHLEESGHQMEAWTTLLNQMERATAGAHDQGLTPFQRSIEELNQSLSVGKEALREFIEPIGEFFLNPITDKVNELTALSLIARDLVHLKLPSFSDDASAGAVSGSAGTTAAKLAGGTLPTASAVSVAQLQQTLNAGLTGTDGSVSGQIASEQRAIEAIHQQINAANQLHEIRGKGHLDDAQYAADIQSLTGQLNQHNVALAGLKTPYQDLIEQQGKTAASAAALTGYQRAMVEADQQVDDAIQRTTGGHATLTERMVAEAGVARTLSAQYAVSTAEILRNVTAQNAIAQAWQSGGAEAAHATNYWAAYNDALDHFSTTAPGFAEAVAKRTQALDALTDAQNKVRLAQQTSQNEDQVSYITAETRSIGMNSDARAVMLAHMQAEQELRREGKDLLSADSQAYLDSVDAVTRATQAYQHQQDVLSDLTGSLSSMADTIGDDITQALIQGAGAGVNFKSALQGIESQVVTMIAKLALIDPLLNSIDGGTRNTLGDIAGLLNGSTSAVSSVGNPFGEADGSASSSSGFSIGQLFNLRQNAASSGNPFASAGSHDVNDASEQVTAIGHIASSGFSFGGVVGGLAGGMSLGSMLGSVGGGTDGTIGSLLGSGIGAAAGSFIPGIGTLIGGLAGGALGGLIGGLFGHKKNPYTLDNVMLSNGQLSLGSVFNQAETDNVTPQLTSDIASINAVLSANGLTASGGSAYQGGTRLGFVGDDANNKDPSLQNLTLAQWLPDLNLSTSDATFQQALDQGMPSSFSSVSDFTTAIASLKTMADTVDSLHVSVSKFNSDATVTVDHIDGYSGDLSTAINALDGQTMDVSTLQQRISEISSTWQQLAYSARSVDARYLAATGDQQGADLENFDVSADQQRADLVSSFETIWGDAYATQSSYVQQSADLEKTLAAERLQIQAEYNGDSIAQQQQYLSQAQQSVASVYSSLSSYAQSLALSSASPLSVQDQYNLAQGSLTSDYQAAQGGDYDALSRIQSDAQSFLGLSQSWQGSGTGYTADYQQTLKILQSLAGADTGALTATLAQKLAQNQVDATNGVTEAVTTMKKALQTDIQQLSRLLVTR
ncbi:phage tail length tape measure family protein [Gluconacetobacter sp. Hr-1-5]|uniref:phage tail length tape measure family protein n=1 Tax=Gluconacetobacter sp. Hr-1-5 TaxID=3395370 RepID=UPI003B515ECB